MMDDGLLRLTLPMKMMFGTKMMIVAYADDVAVVIVAKFITYSIPLICNCTIFRDGVNLQLVKNKTEVLIITNN